MIPVHGRLPLLKVTIERLFNKNGVDHVICIGESEDEKKVINNCGAEYLCFQNKPLGRKWNHGFLKAKEYRPDAVVYAGSSDWLSDNWLPVLMPLIDNGFFMAGKLDYNMVHYTRGIFRAAWWPGYQPETGRQNELIGIGRILSCDFLDAIGWLPFENDWNKGMDFSMYLKLGELQKKGMNARVIAYNSHEIQSLSVSCDQWTNLHLSDFNQPGLVMFQRPELWLKSWFPEALKLEL